MMHQQHHDAQPTQTVNNGAQPDRRKFLRNAGMTAAAAAVVVGITDVTGVRPAFAAAKSSPASKAMVIRTGPNGRLGKSKQVQEIRESARASTDTSYAYFSCTLAPGDCDGACTPAGIWCHYCCTSATHARCAHLCVGGESNYFVAFSYP
jgi:hypothetical protein